MVIFSGCIEQDKKVEDEEEALTLQQLINNASPGDTVYLPNSIYYETITINKPVKLIGEDKKSTIIDGNYEETIIHIKADDVTITNLTVRNSGGHLYNSGIKIQSKNNLINNCIIYRTKTGIYLNNAENNVISNCFFHTNGDGIYFKGTSKNMIENCQFSHNAFGMRLHDSDNLKINNCYVHTNGIGIYGKDSEDFEVTHCSVSDNTHDGGGIWLFNCKNSYIYDCNICHNGEGIRLDNSESNISYCNFHWNMYRTIRVKNSENTVISNCDIRNSFRTAITVKESNCNLNKNNIVGNELYALKYESNFCNARENWWGSITGPSYINSIFGDRVSIKKISLKLVPWSLKPYENIGASWDTKDVFTKIETPIERFNPIEFNEKDTDGDGCPDWWEKKYDYDPIAWDDHYILDPDNDGLNNNEECYTDGFGSDPFYKDIFIEVDWFESKEQGVTNKPPDDLLKTMKSSFKKHDINLHVDIGNLGGGEEISYSDEINLLDLRDLYWKNFLNNDLDNPRKGIFRYAIIMNHIKELYSGCVFIGWDHLDTIVIAAQQIKESIKDASRDQIIVGGLMHELGHLLGLIVDDYDGIDNDESYAILRKSFWKYNTYKSVMNYRYVYSLLDFSDGTHGKNDFNDWGNLDLSFFKNSHFELNSK
jgi:parallel beta-helix repeat protein